MRYAFLRDDVVIYVTESEEPPAAPWVPCGGASPGWLYVDGEFLPPSEGAPS